MTLTLEVSPETAKRVEQARALGLDLDVLLAHALEEALSNACDNRPADVSHPFAHLAGKYKGDAWDELLTELDKNRCQQQETGVDGA